MLEFFLTGEMRPFTIAITLVFGLILLELIMLMLGGSMTASEADGIELDADGFELDADGLEVDADAANTDGPEAEVDSTVSGAGSLSAWLGFGHVPLVIWVAAVLSGFGLSGFVLQSALNGLTGWMLPALLAVPIATLPALAFARVLSEGLGRLVPKSETSAVSRRSLGGHHGLITQGTARIGEPAEARVKDRHGNTHYLRVEPYEEGAELPQGTEIYIVRKRDGTLRAMEINLD